MKKYILFLLIIISTQINAQEKNETTINVSGSAKVSVSPDLCLLNIKLSSTQQKMNEAVSTLGKKSNYYLAILKKLGFKEEDIKTTNFSISKNRVYVNRQYVDSGYNASQSIKIEFNHNKKTLTNILNELSESKEAVDFSFSFRISEKLKQKTQLLIIEEAISDAKLKSERIASSSGLNLIKIKNISYGSSASYSNNLKYSRELSYAADLSNTSETSYNFTPDDITLNNSVSVIWIAE
ncbi:MAG: SIMPL domain-containing protein [Vicingaceae bacterium]